MSSDDRLQRYARHIYCDALGYSAQQTWQQSHIVQVGVGGIGCASAQYLVASGIGKLTLIDHDNISLDNLQRQILFNADHIGLKKVNVAKQVLNQQNPDVAIDAVALQLNQQLALQYFKEADLIIDATDNFTTRYLINDCAIQRGKNLVMGAAIEMAAQWAVFNTADPAQPCYRCLYPDINDQPGSCRTEGVFAPVVGVVGTQLAVGALRLLHQGLDQDTRLFRFDAHTQQFSNFVIVSDQNCQHHSIVTPR